MNRKSPRAQTKLDTTMCQERDDRRSQESCTVPVSVSPVNTAIERERETAKERERVAATFLPKSSIRLTVTRSDANCLAGGGNCRRTSSTGSISMNTQGICCADDLPTPKARFLVRGAQSSSIERALILCPNMVVECISLWENRFLAAATQCNK